MIDLRPDFLDTLKRLLAEIVPDCEVRIFGSRYNWTATDASDLDLALVGPSKLHWKTLTRLKAALEESSLPYRVDVLDWRAISPEFQKVIEQGYEVIQKPGLGRRSNWNKMTLRDAGVCLIDCEHKTPAAQGNGYPYIAIPQIKNGRIDLASVRLISREDFIMWTRKAKPQVHDVVLSRRCNPGETAFVPPNLEFALGQNLVLLRPDGEKLYPPFLRWLVSGPEWWNQIQKYLNAGAIFNSLKCADIPNFELSIPSLSTQRRIADILSALDDKIELNRQTNATLEAIAQAIFKEWFVEFNFPGATGETVESELGIIPKGWRVGNILEIADLLSGGTPKTEIAEYWDGQIKWASAKDVSNAQGTFILDTERTISQAGVDNSSTKILPALTTILTARGTVGSYCILAEPMAMNQTNYGLKAKADRADYFVFISLSNLVAQLQQAAYGTIFDTVTTKTFEQSKIIIPPISLIQNFDRQVAPTMEQILNDLQQSATFAALRDALLPKLMSGEIEV